MTELRLASSLLLAWEILDMSLANSYTQGPKIHANVTKCIWKVKNETLVIGKYIDIKCEFTEVTDNITMGLMYTSCSNRSLSETTMSYYNHTPQDRANYPFGKVEHSRSDTTATMTLRRCGLNCTGIHDCFKFDGQKMNITLRTSIAPIGTIYVNTKANQSHDVFCAVNDTFPATVLLHNTGNDHQLNITTNHTVKKCNRTLYYGYTVQGISPPTQCSLFSSTCIGLRSHTLTYPGTPLTPPAGISNCENYTAPNMTVTVTLVALSSAVSAALASETTTGTSSNSSQSTSSTATTGTGCSNANDTNNNGLNQQQIIAGLLGGCGFLSLFFIFTCILCVWYCFRKLFPDCCGGDPDEQQRQMTRGRYTYDNPVFPPPTLPMGATGPAYPPPVSDGTAGPPAIPLTQDKVTYPRS
ncbi:membrane glycoprotein UL139 [Panine betaherpesvirus 2]|uniref:Membrane glycoprotein UL139 n=1 Tax=Panine betaherpesvirus 2 TaxID=188763 RepID=Q8QRX0_9BETA|nr:membrane glycoprotein UL139 [Panine betaherpesvirus 2]AAM00767.1 membrane glycoprotein UL139 [Panine betaherpesvirus 2]QXV67881.1 membrane glycoprotein UL139 [Panine betaherpesvirus 2]